MWQHPFLGFPGSMHFNKRHGPLQKVAGSVEAVRGCVTALGECDHCWHAASSIVAHHLPPLIACRDTWAMTEKKHHKLLAFDSVQSPSHAMQGYRTINAWSIKVKKRKTTKLVSVAVAAAFGHNFHPYRVICPTATMTPQSGVAEHFSRTCVCFMTDRHKLFNPNPWMNATIFLCSKGLSCKLGLIYRCLIPLLYVTGLH